VRAPSAATADLYGEWRGYSESCCFAEQRRFRNDQTTRRDSVAKRATFDNWRVAAEQGSEMAWSVTTGVVSFKGCCAETRARAATGLRPTTQGLSNNYFESSCGIAAFAVNSEPPTGARLLVRLCVGLELGRCVHIVKVMEKIRSD